MLFAYFGPETVLPLTSTLAAVLGFVLMFGRRLGLFATVAFRAVARRLRRKAGPSTAPTEVYRPAGPRYQRPGAPTDQVRP